MLHALGGGSWKGRTRLRSEADEDTTSLDVSSESSESASLPKAPFSERRALDVGEYNESPWRTFLWMTVYLSVTNFGRVLIVYTVVRDDFIKYRDGPEPKGVFVYKLLDWYVNQWLLWGFGFIWLTNAAMVAQVGSAVRVLAILPILAISKCYPLSHTFNIDLGKGYHSLYFGGWFLLWSALLLLRTGSRPRNFLLVLVCVMFVGIFFAGIDLYVPICNAVPHFAKGFVCTIFLMVMKFGLAHSLKFFMKTWWVEGTNYVVVVALAGMVVALSNTMKCLACIEAVRNALSGSGSGTMWDVLSICLSNLAAEVAERNDMVKGLLYSAGALRWKPRSVVQDLRMQCYFVMSYCYVVPLVPSVLVLLVRQPGLFDINGSSDYLVVTWEFWAALSMFFLANGLSDWITLRLQRQSGESCAAAFHRLQHYGEHRSCFGRPASAAGQPEVDAPPTEEVEESVDVVFFGVHLPSYLLLQVLVIAACVDCWESGWVELISKAESPVRPPLEACTSFL